MLLVIGLLGYAYLLGWGVDKLLNRRWERFGSARAGLRACHALALSVLSTLAVAILLVAHDVWEHGLAWILHADKARVHEVYAGPEEVHAAWNAVLVLLVVGLVVLMVRLCRGMVASRRAGRAHQRIAVAQRSRIGATSGVGVIDHAAPAIYCVMGRRADPRILVTVGAIDTLTPTQLSAALEHERAHLRGRHHTMVAFADALSALFGWLGLLRSYPVAVRRLIEMVADDEAARLRGARTVASALLAMSTSSPLSPAHQGIGWTDGDTAWRIRRMLSPDSPSRATRIVLTVVGAMAVAVPVALPLAPAIDLVGSVHEPLQDRHVDDFVHHE